MRASDCLCCLSVFIALLGSACSPKPNTSSARARSDFQIVPSANPNLDDLKRARLCSDAADTFWSRHNWKNSQDGSVSFTSHFNKQLHRCLVDVRTVSPPKPTGEIVESDQIYNALDENVLASQSLTEKNEDVNADILQASYRKDGRALDQKEVEAFVPWFKALMTQ